jgi:hypothetical protein
MKNIIQFMVTKEQGVYTADGVNVPVVTEGSTFEELQTNIREAVALYTAAGVPLARCYISDLGRQAVSGPFTGADPKTASVVLDRATASARLMLQPS